MKPSRPEMVEIARLIDGGDVKPSIEAVFPLEGAREALEQGLNHHIRGKFVLQDRKLSKQKTSCYHAGGRSQRIRPIYMRRFVKPIPCYRSRRR
ncbi:MAG TPA: zinc-binding dehydrogenase [Thermodesulfobacteriota bacterium]|nr:zinc-binding dehydrogenase [Thermodesulfobacteriota bacterium]